MRSMPSLEAGGVEKMQSGAMGIEPTGNGSVYIGDHWYRGTLVFPTDKGLTAVNYVDLEYLYSVLGSVNGNWPQEALKAQAVAAPTYHL